MGQALEDAYWGKMTKLISLIKERMLSKQEEEKEFLEI